MSLIERDCRLKFKALLTDLSKKMLNSFNLFLFLLTIWVVFCAASGHFSPLYIFCGIFCSAFVVVISARLQLIEKKSEMLFLSFGFYRHFIKLFLLNFLPAILLLFKLAFKQNSVNAVIGRIKSSNDNINISALLTTINMHCGLLVIDIEDKEILIHAAANIHLKKFNFRKMHKILQHINDDHIV